MSTLFCEFYNFSHFFIHNFYKTEYLYCIKIILCVFFVFRNACATFILCFKKGGAAFAAPVSYLFSVFIYNACVLPSFT